MKTLYLLRHAKAEPGGKELNDMDRMLSLRGHEACAQVGIYIKTRRYAPSLVLSSPSVRTKETSELVMQAANIPVSCQIENTLYLATADEILQVIQKTNDTLPSVMVVGHNPGMHHVALLLSRASQTLLREMLELKYPTGSLSVIEFKSNHWQDIVPGNGELVDFITPGQL